MKKRKLTYRIHNPNSTERTTEAILKVFLEVNQKKVDLAIQEIANKN